MHREMADLVQEAPELLNVIAPRGHAKTTILVILAALWHIFCEDYYRKQKPSPKFIVVISKSRGHAVNILTTIKNILEFNPHFRALFGYHGQANASRWREDIIILKNGSIIMCRGWEQQVRGLNIDGMRPSFILTDDIETEENTKTMQTVDHTFRRYMQAVVPALGKGGRIINVGTPQVASSLVYRLQEMEEWTSRKYKAIYTEDGVEQALWPAVWNLERLKARRDDLERLGRVSMFYREYMCEVIGDADQLFRPDFIRYWKGEIGWDGNKNAWLEWRGEKRAVNLYMGCDPASSLTATADYTVIMVVAMDADRNLFIVDYHRERMKPVDVAEKIKEWYLKYRPTKTQVETVGYQEMIRDYLRRDQNMYIPGMEIKNNPRRGKSQRLEGLQPAFARGRVHLRRPHKATNNMEAFEDELLLFPRGKHDDTLDAYYYAVKGAYPPYHDVILHESGQERTMEHTSVFDWMVE